MQIIIVGCGKLGVTLAETLVSEGHDITVVDMNAERINKISSDIDVQGVIGNGVSVNVLTEAGVENSDILIAVTNSDEINLLCCLIAKKVKNINTIARVRNPIYGKERGFLREELGMSMIINPEFASALEIARLISTPSAIQIEKFANGRVELLRFRVPNGCVLDGMRMMDVNRELKSNVLVCSIERGDDVVIPGGAAIIRAKDIISIVASTEAAGHFFRQINIISNPIKNIMIIGGGEISFYLAEMLIRMGIDVRIIEKDRARCEELSELLPKAMIINGDATDKHVLLEDGLASAHAVAAMTNFDEENIFLSLFAKTQSKGKVITKINSINYGEIINSLNLDSIIYPKYLAAEHILAYVRAMQNSFGSNIETLYRLCDNKIEALEFTIKDDYGIVGKPIQELKLKSNVLICCIRHKNSVIIPHGRDVICVGDAVIVVTTQRGLLDIRDILAAK